MKTRRALMLLVGFVFGACSKSGGVSVPDAAATAGTGGVRGTGAVSGSGGAIGSGGTTGSGGVTSTGGAVGTGGTRDAGADIAGGSGGTLDGGASADAAPDAGGTIDARTDAVASDAGIETANKFVCGNWADQRDNFVNGNLLLSGLTATDTYATVLAKSDQILASFQTVVGANSVRLPINEPTVLTAWWDAYKGSIDAAIARGMKVIVAYWAWNRTTGQPTDMAVWNMMWDRVVSDYTDNNLVYFQIFNEPFGYQPAAFINLAAAWIARYPNVPKGRIIVAGNFYDSDVRQQGADARLNGTLLSLHIYPFSNSAQTSVQAWRTMLATNLGNYANRTIVTEWGAPMTTGLDYSAAGDGNNNTSFIVGMSGYLHDNTMGSCYWPVLRTADSWSLTTLTGTGANVSLRINSASGFARIKAAWNQ